MGAGVSIPEQVDADMALALSGDRFDRAKFDEMAVDGKITKQQLEEAATVALAQTESAPDLAQREVKPAAVERQPSVRSKAARQLLIAVDGTDLAHSGFEAAMRGHNEGDRVVVLYCGNREKEGLPEEMRAPAIKARYKQALKDSQVPSSHYMVDTIDINDGDFEHTKEAVSNYANQLVNDLFTNELAGVLMFSGYSGRKGLYGVAGKKAEMMGSTTDMSMREAKCSNMIVKPGSVLPAIGEKATYVVYVDGNASAELAACEALSMMTPGDEVVFVHLSHDADAGEKPDDLIQSWWPSEIKAKYEAMTTEFGREGRVLLVKKDKKHVYDLAVPLEIKKVVDEVGANFVVLAADMVGSFHYNEGMQLQPVTDTAKSVSDRVVRQSHVTVLVTYSRQTAEGQIIEEARGQSAQVKQKRRASHSQGALNQEQFDELGKALGEAPKG
jgi:nucleotide-binding universal stress UspA family protein